MSVTTRPVELSDIPAITELIVTNREFLAPWEPAREESWFTRGTQEDVLRVQLAGRAAGTWEGHVILVDGQIAGRININDIVRGPFLNGHMGYWVAQHVGGRGVATAAVQSMKRVAFGELGLHRIQAGTLPHNFGSQKVLQRNGFVQFGHAPRYLRIAGEWQDHLLFQVLNED